LKPEDRRFEVGVWAFFGACALVWFALQGEYLAGLFAFVLCVALAEPYARLRAWSIRSRRDTAERAAAWAREHPEQSRRLRWVVFPLMGLLWAWILWNLFG
jgi:hypothetical protein